MVLGNDDLVDEKGCDSFYSWSLGCHLTCYYFQDVSSRDFDRPQFNQLRVRKRTCHLCSHLSGFVILIDFEVHCLPFGGIVLKPHPFKYLFKQINFA